MIRLEERQAVADALAHAERERVPIEPPTEAWPGLDTDDAYAIQLLNAEARIGAGGVVRGHKVGLTSRAMQQMLGVTEPDYGHLFDDMFVLEGDVARCDAVLPSEGRDGGRFRTGGPDRWSRSHGGRGATEDGVRPAGDRGDRQPGARLADHPRRHHRRQRLVGSHRARRESDAARGYGRRLLGGILRRRGEIVETGARARCSATPRPRWPGWPTSWPHSVCGSRRDTS